MAHEIFERLPKTFRDLCEGVILRVDDFPTDEVLDEMDAVYTPVMKRGQSESARSGDVAQRYGHPMTQTLQRYCPDQIEYWARCKRAALLYDWIEGTPVDVLERRYSTTPFAGAILDDFLENRWSRSHDTHLATNDIDQLGQLVDAEPPKPAANGRNPWVVAHLEHWPRHFI